MAAVANTETAGFTHLHVWALTTADPTGDSVSFPGARDRAVHAYGTWGGATMAIQGSMDGTNWFTLHDESGVALTFTADGGHAIQENTLHLRAALTAVGVGATVNVKILSGRTY